VSEDDLRTPRVSCPKCGDPECAVHGMMFMHEFELHRAKLAKGLSDWSIRHGFAVESVLPSYEKDELFSALLVAPKADGGTTDRIAVCVKSTHPFVCHDGGGPGQPTWVWEDDLNSL